VDRLFFIVVLVVTLFTGFLIGYSVPPFIHAGVFTAAKEKGVESQINRTLEQHYKDLYKTDEQ
jgi:hypothetical protein